MVSGLTTVPPKTLVPSNGLRSRPPADETVSTLSTIVPSAEASVMATEEFSEESSSSPSASPSNPPEDLPSLKEVYLRQFVNALIMLAFLAGVILTYFGLRELYWWSQVVTAPKCLQCNRRRARRQEARAREAAAARQEATRWENYQEKVWRQVLAEQEAVMESQQAATARSTTSQ